MAITARILFNPTNQSREESPKNPNPGARSSDSPSKNALIAHLRNKNHLSDSDSPKQSPKAAQQQQQQQQQPRLAPSPPSIGFQPNVQVPMVDDDVDEEVPPPHFIPMQHLQPQDNEQMPLMQQQQYPENSLPSPSRRRPDRESSPFMMPVQDLSALPLGTNYGWRVED